MGTLEAFGIDVVGRWTGRQHPRYFLEKENASPDELPVCLDGRDIR